MSAVAVREAARMPTVRAAVISIRMTFVAREREPNVVMGWEGMRVANKPRAITMGTVRQQN